MTTVVQLTPLVPTWVLKSRVFELVFSPPAARSRLMIAPGWQLEFSIEVADEQ